MHASCMIGKHKKLPTTTHVLCGLFLALGGTLVPFIKKRRPAFFLHMII